MLVLPNFTPEDENRAHPWGVTSFSNRGGAYYDFKQHPELISEVLEDFHLWGLLDVRRSLLRANEDTRTNLV